MRSHVIVPSALVLLVGAMCVSGVSAQARASATQARPGVTAPAAIAPTPLNRPSFDAGPTRGRIEGLVTDDQGQPLVGVAVSAHGAQLTFAVTDRHGRFAFTALPLGSYFVRAHLPGFVASPRELVEVIAARAATSRFRLSRSPDAVPSTRPILPAGMDGLQPLDPDRVQDGAAEDAAAADSDHGHSPTDWRIRHLKRSVLRDADNGDLSLAEDTPEDTVAADTVQSLSFLSDLPFSTQVQLLTISAFDTPQELFTAARIPHGVAYVSLTSPAGDDSMWAVQGALTQGDLSSWVLGGTYTTKIAGRHATEVSMSYAAQRYDGTNPIALSAMGETSRTVGALHGSDRWTLTPAMSLTAGARYAHYGYIDGSGLLSPSIQWEFKTADGHTLRALVSQQMVAPGAEEFVPSPVAGMWMPPQRTFSPLNVSEGFRAERTRHFEVALEEEMASFRMTARGFHQQVSDQIVTVFGLRKPDEPRADLGHYFTARAGNVDAYGWGLTVSRPVASRVCGSVAYTMARANWVSSADSALYAAFASSAKRASDELIHDLTTTLETDFPETATHVVAVYKLNSGYANDNILERIPGVSGRFDVQVHQRLPFLATDATEWEILIAVRNLFRDSLDGASLYDELLVVRPPKRIVGGLTVRF
jgi:hypothetical protein